MIQKHQTGYLPTPKSVRNAVRLSIHDMGNGSEKIILQKTVEGIIIINALHNSLQEQQLKKMVAVTTWCVKTNLANPISAGYVWDLGNRMDLHGMSIKQPTY